MITVPVWLALVALGAVSFAAAAFSFFIAGLCRAAARDAAEYDAADRMFAGADAIDRGDA